MKYFLAVIGQLAIWTPPDGIDGFTFLVDSKAREISVEMRSCRCFENRTFAADAKPDEVREHLDEMARSTIMFRYETHAAKESVHVAKGDFYARLTNGVKRDQ